MPNPAARSLALLACLLVVSSSDAIGANGDNEVIIRPEAAPGPLDNPLKGWCPYTDANPIRQPYSMVYFYATWKELEPREGEYAFEAWEKRAWSVPEAKGKHVVFRMFVDYPSRPSGLPDWLVQKGVKRTRYEEHGGGLATDFDDPRVIQGMERLIEALGERYNGHPRVAFIELGLLGFWGEWHTWPKSQLYARPETERRVIQAYRRAFPDKILMAREARDEAARQPWLGFHDDMFPEDTDNGQAWSFLAKIRQAGRSENWLKAAVGGEMVPGQARKWLGVSFNQTDDLVKRSHFSWVGPYCPALEQDRSPDFKLKCEALVRTMGYQYRIEEVRHPATIATGGNLSIKIEGKNEGVAPFYYPWPVELTLLDPQGKPVERYRQATDIREWRPGSFHFEANPSPKVPPGRYSLAVGIIDPWTNKPAIAFANKLANRDGWIVLSTVQIGSK